VWLKQLTTYDKFNFFVSYDWEWRSTLSVALQPNRNKTAEISKKAAERKKEWRNGGGQKQKRRNQFNPFLLSLSEPFTFIITCIPIAVVCQYACSKVKLGTFSFSAFPCVWLCVSERKRNYHRSTERNVFRGGLGLVDHRCCHHLCFLGGIVNRGWDESRNSPSDGVIRQFCRSHGWS